MAVSIPKIWIFMDVIRWCYTIQALFDRSMWIPIVSCQPRLDDFDLECCTRSDERVFTSALVRARRVWSRRRQVVEGGRTVGGPAGGRHGPFHQRQQVTFGCFDDSQEQRKDNVFFSVVSFVPSHVTNSLVGKRAFRSALG